MDKNSEFFRSYADKVNNDNNKYIIDLTHEKVLDKITKVIERKAERKAKSGKYSVIIGSTFNHKLFPEFEILEKELICILEKNGFIVITNYNKQLRYYYKHYLIFW